MTSRGLMVLAALLGVVAGCGGGSSPGGDAGADAFVASDTGGPNDSGRPSDAGSPNDTGSPSDTGSPGDGGSPSDSGSPDTGGDAALARVPVDHRPDDSACSAPAPAGNCSIGGGLGGCSTDADCTAGTNGRCNMNLGGAAFCRCTYDVCTHDTDCGPGLTCACHGSALYADGNACFTGNCRVDSDCGAHGYCSPTIAESGCGGLGGYYCHTASDTCIDDSDCSGGGLMACEFVASSSRWECVARLFCP